MARPAFTEGQRRLARLRLAAQRLGAERAESPAEAVRWMLALQAQDLPGVKWSVGLRTTGATERDVEAALDAGQLVRSWPMRGTLHLVAAEDLPWMLELTTSRAIASAAQRRTALGITEAEIERARETAIEALSGGRTLPRSDLLGAIQAGGVSTAAHRGYHLLWYLAQTGTLVMGGATGRGQAFALVDEWVRGRLRLEPDEALGELARRYFASHGPATVADLVRWSGLTVRDVRRGLAVAGAALTTIEVEGATYH
ncbi:MAG: winged helix DNA-binding domain-containing protein, partial [Candidatus Limnocylindrales bacterium]